MRQRRRPSSWVARVGIDVPEPLGVEAMRGPTDLPALPTVLAVFSGAVWFVAGSMAFLDLRAGVVAGTIATWTVLVSGRSR